MCTYYTAVVDKQKEKEGKTLSFKRERAIAIERGML
jgi:hypothetical protein